METGIGCPWDGGYLRTSRRGASFEFGQNPSSAHREESGPDLWRTSRSEVPDQLADRIDAVTPSCRSGVLSNLLKNSAEQLVV